MSHKNVPVMLQMPGSFYYVSNSNGFSAEYLQDVLNFCEKFLSLTFEFGIVAEVHTVLCNSFCSCFVFMFKCLYSSADAVFRKTKRF